MERQKSLTKNFIMNIILTMSSILFPIITFPYVSRILLPEGMGKVSFAISTISYFSIFAQLGIPIYGIRICAKVRDNKEELSRICHELLLINTFMSIISYLIFMTVLFSIPKLSDEKALFLIVSTTLLFNVIGMEWLYKGLEQYTYITVRSIVFKVIALLAMFLLVHKQDDYVIYGGISIFASSASSILNFINAHKYINLKLLHDYNLKRHLKPIAIFFAMSCATTIYGNLDNVMLGFMKTNTDVGFYNAAVKIKGVLVSIITSLGTVLLPRASYYIQYNYKDKFLDISQKAIHFVIILAVPMIFYFILYARESIYFLSGSAYEGAIIPMQVIMPTLLFIGLTNIMGLQMLVPLGKEKMVLYSVITGAAADLLINILLIPKLSSTGAAIGTVAAESVVWIIQYLSLRNIVYQMYKKVKYIPIGIGVLLGTIGTIWIKLLSLNIFLTLIISAIIYFGIYYIVLVIFKEPLIIEIRKQFLLKLLHIVKKNK